MKSGVLFLERGADGLGDTLRLILDPKDVEVMAV
jgi:hypothetical protein